MWPPGRSHGAATVRLRNRAHFRRSSGASAADRLQEAIADPSIDTRFSVLALHETLVAEALVAPFQVHATAMLAEAGVDGALVDVLTLVRHPYLLVARWTDAHESADQILALEPTVVRRRRAFVNVYAMAAIGRQSVPVRADAPEGARRVVAPEGALIAQLQTLVHVLAHLMSPGRVSLVAGALETAVDVAASAVAADILHGQTLVVIHASPPGFVQDVSGRALAPEGAVRVDALATVTGIRHKQTFIQIDPGIVPSRPFRAHPLEFLAILGRALLAVTAPSLAHRAATVLLGHAALPWEAALASSIIIVALLLPDIDTLQRVRSIT